jgi:hypothetical protein
VERIISIVMAIKVMSDKKNINSRNYQFSQIIAR